MTKALDTFDKERLEKVAKMLLWDVPAIQIAASLRVSEGRISQLRDTPEFKEILSRISAEHFEEQELLNQGWDAVESLSINRVVQHLQCDPEPDFALRAAIVANKAVRRGAHRQNPINPQGGASAVIELNTVFVQNLQQNINSDCTKRMMAQGRQINLEKKVTNCLSPAKVQDLLAPAKIPTSFGNPNKKSLKDSITDSITDSIASSMQNFLPEN